MQTGVAAASADTQLGEVRTPFSFQVSSVPVLGALVYLTRRDPSTWGVRTGPAAFVSAVWLALIQSV